MTAESVPEPARPAPARVLVAYASKYGSTREIADAIGETLRRQGLVADVQAAARVESLEAWDAVVLGSGLYSATWLRDANRFVRRHLAELQRRPVWLFSSGPLEAGVANAEPPITVHVADTTGAIGAREHRTFAGRLLADAPDITPSILATHRTGDFREWTAIHAWAREIAAALVRPT
jgi:menaquinone-dependent protoporphyrinogen oxidase